MKYGIKKRTGLLIVINRISAKNKQGGIVLLLLIVALAITVSVFYFSNISVVQIQTRNIQETRIALKAAKNALIAYATLRSDLTKPSLQPAKYGYLPCPANNNGDGNSAGSCGGSKKNTIGWFPWKSLGLTPIKDSSGECLLYVVSSTYKYNPEAGMLNEDTNYGMLQVVDENNNIIYGDSAQNRVVAIIFSPGVALTGQSRVKDPNTDCRNDVNNFSAYLDEFEVSSGVFVKNWELETGVNKVDQFVQITSPVNDSIVNDGLTVITRGEIWPAVITHRSSEFDIVDMTGASKVRRLTEALARCLASYANDNDNSSLPYPAPMGLTASDYRDNVNYADTNASYIGRFPYITAAADPVIPGTVSNSVLFDKAFSTGAGISECNALNILSPVGSDADLRSSSSVERRLWNNWKERILYAVSERYAARATPANDLVQPRCNDGSAMDNCIRYSGTEYAAIVMYAGERLVNVDTDPGPAESLLTQVRAAPIAAEDDDGIGDDVVDSKLDEINYIEVIDSAGSGAGDGDFTRQIYSNDLFFCLTDTEPVDVIECS